MASSLSIALPVGCEGFLHAPAISKNSSATLSVPRNPYSPLLSSKLHSEGAGIHCRYAQAAAALPPTSMRHSPLRIDRLQILRGRAPPSRRCKLPPGHDEWNGCGCALLAGVLGCRNLGGNAVRMDSRSILHLKCGALLGPPASAVIHARGRNIRVPQPLLHLGDIRPV